MAGKGKRPAVVGETSRARRKLSTTETVRERVRYIAGEMAAGRWDGYATRQKLATEWSLSDAAIRKYAAEASRSLALDPEEVEQQKLAHAAYASRIMREALGRRNRQTGLPDFRSALEANRDAARFRGIEVEPPKRVDVTSDGEPLSGGLVAVFTAIQSADATTDPESKPEADGGGASEGS